MTFESYVVALAAVLYIMVGISYAIKGNYVWSMIWISYGIANIGLTFAALNK